MGFLQDEGLNVEVEDVDARQRAGHDAWGSRCVDQHQFGIFQRGDLEPGFIADRGAVAGVDAHAVDFDRARRRHQIEVRAAPGLYSALSPAFSVVASTRASARIGSASLSSAKPLAMVTKLPERSAFGNGLAPQVG